jgi:hypothetical protein
MIIVSKMTIAVGKKGVIESPSPAYEHYLTVFEDDGETGYFYAVDKADKDFMVDALLIYNVEKVTDKNIPSEVAIGWSEDGLASLLLTNEYPHAIINFKNKNGYCRTGFPPPSNQLNWSNEGHGWKEGELTIFH